jgi:hypothetical protein
MALANRRPLRETYRASIQTIDWMHLISLPLGALLAALWRIDLWLWLVAIVPVALAGRLFKALASWQAESLRSQALAREARQFAGKLELLQAASTAMTASFEPVALLQTISSQLAALLEAGASWVILLDEPHIRLVAASGIPLDFSWDAPA